jgi:hypothetical protein
MTEQFAAPGAAGDGFSVADANGHLVVIEVHSLETGVVTSLGERDAISATVHDVDAEHTYEDCLIFPKVMIGSLKSRVGQRVLGTIGQGVAKPGQNPPWIIQDASGDQTQAAKAVAYLEKWKAGEFTAPEPAAPAVTQVDLTDPKVVAALAALQAQGLTK